VPRAGEGEVRGACSPLARHREDARTSGARVGRRAVVRRPGDAIGRACACVCVCETIREESSPKKTINLGLGHKVRFRQL